MLSIMDMMPDRLAADRQNQIKKLKLLVLVDILIWFFLRLIHLNSTINYTSYYICISRLRY
jgi:hypothetical protein